MGHFDELSRVWPTQNRSQLCTFDTARVRPTPAPARRQHVTRLMEHEIAKILIENAATRIEREEAIRTAVQLGMPLSKIEEFLDWLDLLQKMLEEETS